MYLSHVRMARSDCDNLPPIFIHLRVADHTLIDPAGGACSHEDSECYCMLVAISAMANIFTSVAPTRPVAGIVGVGLLVQDVDPGIDVEELLPASTTAGSSFELGTCCRSQAGCWNLSECHLAGHTYR